MEISFLLPVWNDEGKAEEKLETGGDDAGTACSIVGTSGIRTPHISAGVFQASSCQVGVHICTGDSAPYAGRLGHPVSGSQDKHMAWIQKEREGEWT